MLESRLSFKGGTMTERYNINRSFEENKKEGPYGFEKIEDNNRRINSLLKSGGIKTDFFGFETKLPLGVAAGPLFSPKYMKAAALDGFSVVTWKTFRSQTHLAHRNNGDFSAHNIGAVKLESMLAKNNIGNEIEIVSELPENKKKLSITNSFGMGSDAPSIWKEEVLEIEKWMNSYNKKTIASAVGSPKPGWTVKDLAEDYAKVATILEECGIDIIELNFSCPNVSSKEGAIYKNPKDSAHISKIVRESLKNRDTKLLLKVGYSTKEDYRALLLTVNSHIDGIVAINTIPMKVVDRNKKQALPGGLISGVCGFGILDLAVKAVEDLVELREELDNKLKIIGCGGVTSPEAAMRHINAGADFVMCATSAFFNPALPLEFAKYINKYRGRLGQP